MVKLNELKTERYTKDRENQQEGQGRRCGALSRGSKTYEERSNRLHYDESDIIILLGASAKSLQRIDHVMLQRACTCGTVILD
jgi:hypothetical protein